MHFLPVATEASLIALLTYHPTMTTMLAVVGILVILSIAIMAISVLLRKKFAEPRPPEKWDKVEVFIMSMFLHAGHNPKRPFGQDTYSKRMNSRRIEFAKHYAKTLRNMFVDMA